MSIKWTTISQFSFHQPPEIVLGRSVEMDNKYKDHAADLAEKGISSLQYLKDKYFSGEKEGAPCTVALNNFPYDMEEGIQHYLVWVNPNYQGEQRFRIEDFGYVRDWVLEKFCGGDEETLDRRCVYFQNIERLRSVKAIPHLHIFIRKEWDVGCVG